MNDSKPKIEKIAKAGEVMVEGDILVEQEDGSIAEVHVIVGRPQPTPDGQDYYCPIQAEDFFKGVMVCPGIGPVDSLMNAMTVLRLYTYYVCGLSDELPEFLPRPTLRRGRAHR